MFFGYVHGGVGAAHHGFPTALEGSNWATPAQTVNR